MLKKLLGFVVLLTIPLTAFAGPTAEETTATGVEGYVQGTFNEAPLLQQMVVDGELPPVDQRIPANPPVSPWGTEIGTYGGSLKQTYIEGDAEGHSEDFIGLDAFFEMGPDAQYHPFIGESYEISDDNRSITIRLYEGIRWSDGEPLTADDILFAAEVVQSPNFRRSRSWWDESWQFSKADDHTFTITGENPRLNWLNFLSKSPHLFFFPLHYYRDMHPKYNSEITEEQFKTTFIDLYNKVRVSGDVPTLGMYKKVIQWDAATRILLERNPYFHQVDKAGNQLPYIDYYQAKLVQGGHESRELPAIAGETTFHRISDMTNYPLAREAEQEGKVQTRTIDYGFADHASIGFSYNTDDAALHELFNDIRFRQALAYGIDREAVNEALLQGLGEAIGITTSTTEPFYDPELDALYSSYEPEKSKQLLDEIGVVDTDGDGYRELPDGSKLSLEIEWAWRQKFLILVADQWRGIGIKAEFRERTKQFLNNKIRLADVPDFQLVGGAHINSIARLQPPLGLGQPYWYRAWGKWFESGGTEGAEPPAFATEMNGLYTEIITATTTEQQNASMKQLLRVAAENVLYVGIVGRNKQILLFQGNLRNLPDEVVSFGHQICGPPCYGQAVAFFADE